MKHPVYSLKQKIRAKLKDFTLPLILIAYGYTAVFTPPLEAIDSAGTKFLALALLNLAAYLWLMFQKEHRPAWSVCSSFLMNRTGMIYTLFLLINALSFFKAGNQGESYLALAKLFSVFTAVWIVATLFRKNPGYLTAVAVAMVILLFVDAVSVFYQMFALLEKYPKFSELYTAFINEIITGYSNKNILSSAIFIKLVFALYLWTFKRGILKFLGLAATFTGMMALMPLSTRAFYVGLVILAVTYLLFLFMRFLVDRRHWKAAVISLTIVALIPLFIYLGWRGLSRYLPEAGLFNLRDKLTERLSTIRSDISAGTRLDSWERSVRLVTDEPLLGVGPGNWKIAVLKYENQNKADYAYYFHNHNDFLQIAAETGIFGGILYLMIFLSVAWAFLQAIFRGAASGMSYELLFIPAFGLLLYSVDAFFNFPYDRPEIQSLWAIFLGAAVAFTPQSKTVRRMVGRVQGSKFKDQGSKSTELPTSSDPDSTSLGTRPSFFVLRSASYVLCVFFLCASIYILNLNFRSLRLQRMVWRDLQGGVLTNHSSVFLEGFPAIPTIGIEGEPIALSKARYLINEGEFRRAISLLKNDRSSPYESRSEFFIARAYMDLRNTDSALFFARRVYEVKPLFYDNINLLLILYDQKGLYDEALRVIDGYVASSGNTALQARRDEIGKKAMMQHVEAEYYMGMNYFERKNYREAAAYFSQIVAREPALPDGWLYRARCYFNLNEYSRSAADLDHLLQAGSDDPQVKALREQVRKISGS